MNDNYSYAEWIYKKRWLAPFIRRAIESHPIVALVGARQVGKSTLLRNESPFSDWRYLNLDDFDVLAQAKEDPLSLIEGHNRLILDEVQRASDLFGAVKLAVDSSERKKRFILSGSANLFLMKKVSESLAGRAVYFTLLPMTLGEVQGVSKPMVNLRSLFEGNFPKEKILEPPQTEVFDLMWKGFMPPLLKLNEPESILQWWEGYVMTYLERDSRQLSQVDSLPDFRRLMVALALRCGNLLNQTEIARDISMSQPTVHRYINLLETTCVLERIPAFFVNRTKRLLKTPKIYWNDPGLASFLSGHFNSDSLRNSREAGGIFEAMVYLHLKALAQLLIPHPRAYYWRTVSGKEVDFVLEWGRNLLAIEVKLSTRLRFADTKNLRLFLEEYPETSAGILIYNGNEIRKMGKKIIALPWHALAL